MLSSAGPSLQQCLLMFLLLSFWHLNGIIIKISGNQFNIYGHWRTGDCFGLVNAINYQ